MLGARAIATIITFTHPTTREIIMRRLSTIVGSLLIAATPALAESVIIDAADGGTEVEVQAALDANPENTSFLLLGNFAFSAAVHIEKSGTRIIGDWVDTNGDGKPDPGDDWNTVINAIPNMYGFSEAFILMPTDELGSEGYDVEDVEVSGLHISGFNWTVSQHFFASWDQPGCRTEELPYRLSGMRVANNWIEGGGMYINRRVEEATIDNNLFTLFEGNEMFRHAVEMRGLEWSECGMPFSVDDPGQEGLTITNNVFVDGRDISVGTQNDLRITRNTMTGTTPYGDPAGRSSYKIWISQASGAEISDNVFEGGPTDHGINFWSRTNVPVGPDTTSDSVSILDNLFIDTNVGIGIGGGTHKTTIKGNTFTRSGTQGPVGLVSVAVLDVYVFGHGGEVDNPSSNVSIAHNHIAGGGVAGVVLNGGTTGVDIKHNSYDNPYSLSGDVLLAPEDIVFGKGDTVCPAHGNKVVSDLPLVAVVVDGYSDRCAGSKPNKLQGDGIFEVTP